MERWHFLGVILVGLGLVLLQACADDGQVSDDGPRNVPFTAIPSPTPVPKLCGNGTVDDDPAIGEECDPTASTNTCGAGESCVCCVCLGEDEGLGERTFTVARPFSAFLSTGLAGSDISNDPWLMGPLVLRAGRPDPDAPPDIDLPDDNCPTPAGELPTEAACSATLELVDAPDSNIVGFNDPIQGTFCGKFFAEGSSGFVDCDGGSAHDVTVTIDSMGAADEGPTEICRNQGDPLTAGPGAATLRLDNSVFIRVPFDGVMARPAAEICPTLNYDDPFDPAQIAQYNISVSDILVGPAVLTTGTTTGEVLNPLGAATVFLNPFPGQNFVCSSFSETDARGGLVGNFAGLDNPLAGGDTMNGLRLFDANP